LGIQNMVTTVGHEQEEGVLEDLVAWLNDAYGMELALAEMLEAHIRDMDDFPEHQERLRDHLRETEGHAERVRECLQILGFSVFDAKAMLGDVFGRSQGVALGMADDEIVRCLMAEAAAEHFEIACYRALVTAAEELGNSPVTEICRGILAEEEAMACWLYEQIPAATRYYLKRRGGRVI
jgi:ferritin-like metal-binding protein YciE